MITAVTVGALEGPGAFGSSINPKTGHDSTAKDRLFPKVPEADPLQRLYEPDGLAARWSEADDRAFMAGFDEDAGEDQYSLEKKAQSGMLYSRADPMADAFGKGIDSNPQEIAAYKQEISAAGVELIEKDGEALGYCPGANPGRPGTVYVSKDASYGAWVHEMQHLRDDQAAGWLGMRVIADFELRYEWEVRAYNKEIELALKAGRPDIARKLMRNLEAERRAIYGETDHDG